MTATKTIKQTVKIKATPQQVYDALMDTKKHTKFTGAPAKINKKIGGSFTCYDDYIQGINLELEPGELIVQAWRSKGWPKGHYSTVSFQLSKVGSDKTKIVFTHRGVPSKDVKDKSKGWETHYWTPLKAMLEN